MIAALVPARNAEHDIPGYLESVGRFADAVVALDDGSTDRTAELLEASPLVERLLQNPRRHTYAGWDDSANRQRLLDAAAPLDPDWVVFLDADERIDREDAVALRGFLGADALDACAYGLRLYRMWGDDRCVAMPSYVYRLFAHARGLELPAARLHFHPVPVTIPQGAWVRTTIRARHLDSPERLAARREKYRQAGGSAAPRLQARLLAEPEQEPVAWARRPPALGVLDIRGEGATEAPEASREKAGKLVCLLPARNAEHDIPGYLGSVGRFADAVVALDDGSTDRTAELLEASPLVQCLLQNPRRHTYAGWDDSANRQRLLDAAAPLDPDWVVFVDADERIDREDGAAIRELVEGPGRPGHAYGFRVFRMVGDAGHYDQAKLWVYRMFRFEPGQELPSKRLHLVPVPTSIPRERLVKTTIRIQHLGGLTEDRRAARLRKYDEADPERMEQRAYGHLLRVQPEAREWRTRPAGTPLLEDRDGATPDRQAIDLDAPLLSAIVIARDDEDRIERAVRAVVEQEVPAPFEVIVVVSGRDRTAEIVRRRFPQVRLVTLREPALPGAARNAGLAVARGEYVSFPGSHVELPPGSLAARLRAHEMGYPMVTGTLLNGTPTRSGWASYFLDASGALPGRPSGELAGPPARCSYARDFLVELGGFPETLRAGEDTVVNNELARRGLRAYRAREVALIHRSPCRGPWKLVRHHFARGRALGAMLMANRQGGAAPRRPGTWRYTVAYARRRMADTDQRVARWGGDLRGRYRRVRPLVAAGVGAAALGLAYQLLRSPNGVERQGAPEQEVDYC
jgi:glycosyltransferase involved in cell wall biosynthesis